jgi:hypothetical protein
MHCRDVERWLDEGGPASSQVDAHAHARVCARCQASLAAVDELQDLLQSPGVPAPRDFADRVMARVAQTRQAGALIPVIELLPFFPPVPWWVRVALEPASLLAMLLASVLIWQGDRLFALATGGAVQLAAWLAQTLPAGTASGAARPAADAVWLQPAALTCMALGALPLALMGSRLLYRWSASLVGPRHAR